MNSITTSNCLTDIYQPDCEENIKRLHLWTMFINYLSLAKANVFLKYKWTGSDRLNQIFKINRWYRKMPILRQNSIKFGSSWVMYKKSIVTNDITLKIVNSIKVQYVDDILISFAGTNMDIYPDTTKIYDYYSFDLINGQTRIILGTLEYSLAYQNWEIKVNNYNQTWLNTNKIPVTELPNNEDYKSSFKDTGYLINLCVDHLFKIDKDIKLGTNKFLLNIRGAPTGKGFIETLRKYEQVLEKGTIVADQMLMINPNSANPLDRMYGSLQSEQLWYGFKMSYGNLKEQLMIMANSQSKTSAQQNTLEISQEAQIIDDDNKKNKYLWEEVLTELAYNILKFDNDILFASNDLNAEIKCEIEMNDNKEIIQEQNNFKQKGASK